MTVQFETVGYKELERALRQEPVIAERETRSTLEEGAELVATEARARLHTRTGKTKVYTRVQGSGPQLRAMVKLRGRGAFWGQRGRSPGKAPPLNIVMGWVRRMGLVRGTFDVATRQRTGTIRATKGMRTAESAAAFMIARSIARKGTKGQPFLFPAYGAVLPRVRALFAELPARIMRAVVAEARS